MRQKRARSAASLLSKGLAGPGEAPPAVPAELALAGACLAIPAWFLSLWLRLLAWVLRFFIELGVSVLSAAGLVPEDAGHQHETALPQAGRVDPADWLRNLPELQRHTYTNAAPTARTRTKEEEVIRGCLSCDDIGAPGGPSDVLALDVTRRRRGRRFAHRDNTLLVVFYAGNPGSALFYKDFLLGLGRRLAAAMVDSHPERRARVQCLGFSVPGHTKSTENRNHDEHLTIETGVAHHLACGKAAIAAAVDADTPVLVAGHSIGTLSALRLASDMDQDRLSRCLLLMPSLWHVGNTLGGRTTALQAGPLRRPVVHLARGLLANLGPKARRAAIRFAVGHPEAVHEGPVAQPLSSDTAGSIGAGSRAGQPLRRARRDVPRCAFDAALGILSADVGAAALRYAHSEFTQLGDIDHEAVQYLHDNGEKVRFLFAEGDPWHPHEAVAWSQSAVSDEHVAMIPRRVGVTHAFVMSRAETDHVLDVALSLVQGPGASANRDGNVGGEEEEDEEEEEVVVAHRTLNGNLVQLPEAESQLASELRARQRATRLVALPHLSTEGRASDEGASVRSSVLGSSTQSLRSRRSMAVARRRSARRTGTASQSSSALPPFALAGGTGERPVDARSFLSSASQSFRHHPGHR